MNILSFYCYCACFSVLYLNEKIYENFAHLEKLSSILLQSLGLITPFLLLKHLNPPLDDLEILHLYESLGDDKQQENSLPVSLVLCDSHPIGVQLWLEAESDGVVRANSPTREQRRGEVSCMMIII